MSRLIAKLARADAEDQILSERQVDKSSILMGRGSDCDWVLDDPDRLLSRHHCELKAGPTGMFLTDLSSNGIEVKSTGERLARGSSYEIRGPEDFVIGGYVLNLSIDATVPQETATEEGATGVPDSALPEHLKDASPTEAFLAGAQLDATALTGDGDAAAMYTAGKLFRTFVISLCDLLNDRSIVKAQFRAEQTMVARGQANPFKVFKPEEIAQRLLGAASANFMSAEDAVEGSFKDVKRHQMAVLAGMNVALENLVHRMGPDEVERLLESKSTISVLSSGGKKGAAWDAYRTQHDQIEKDIADLDNSRFMADFRKGYDARMKQLENMDR